MRSKFKLLPPIIALIVNNTVYFGSRLLMSDVKHYNIDSPLDALIPFVPAWVIIYLGCYLFWIVNYCLIAASDDETCYRFYTADFLGRMICLVFFILLPTTNTRPELIGTDFFTNLVRQLYVVDAADNLFPSIHCLVSWYCCVGIRPCTWIPKWYKIVSYMLAIGVCISTVCLKQHVLVDVISGIVIAELTYYICQKRDGYRTYQKICGIIEAKLPFRNGNNDGK